MKKFYAGVARLCKLMAPKGKVVYIARDDDYTYITNDVVIIRLHGNRPIDFVRSVTALEPWKLVDTVPDMYKSLFQRAASRDEYKPAYITPLAYTMQDGRKQRTLQYIRRLDNGSVIPVNAAYLQAVGAAMDEDMITAAGPLNPIYIPTSEPWDMLVCPWWISRDQISDAAALINGLNASVQACPRAVGD